MEAKDLRLGNWLLNPVQDCAVPMDSRILYDIISREKAKIDIGWEPIELNESWLKDFGFINDSIQIQTPHITLNIASKVGAIWIYLHDSLTNDSFPLKNLSYVHQLQNLYFALTGEELTLKS